MSDEKGFCMAGCAGGVLGAMLLIMLTGCVGYVEGPSTGYAFATQDDYVYYPQYECYYSVSRHQYAYREGNAWVARSAPRGVSADVVTASPSVKMNFHDSPAQHHAAVVKQYPKNWSPAAAKSGQSQKNDQHGENNSK